MLAGIRRSASLSAKFARQYGTTPEGPLKRTALYDLHKELGGKMVPFAGWEMPVQYPEGVLKEHLHCRSVSSLFDVSHMGQLKLHGKDRVEFIEKLVVGDIAGLAPHHSRLSVFTNDKGGIQDDTVITNAGDYLYVVVNAGCADKDIAHLNHHLKAFKAQGKDVSMEFFSDQNSLIAIQGPATQKILQQYTKEDLGKLDFMTQRAIDINGISCLVTRCGYTGEDGFEISVPTKRTVDLTKTFLTPTSEGTILPTGLGARDSLRLEAGLCLYGHDLNEEITPIEGALGWLINKRRREQAGFIGSDVILRQIKEGVAKKRVGLIVKGAPAREETTIHNEKGEEIGKITSGTFSPVLKQAIAMGYVKSEYSKIDTPVLVKVRGKDQPATISKMPFVPHQYKKASK